MSRPSISSESLPHGTPETARSPFEYAGNSQATKQVRRRARKLRTRNTNTPPNRTPPCSADEARGVGLLRICIGLRKSSHQLSTEGRIRFQEGPRNRKRSASDSRERR